MKIIIIIITIITEMGLGAGRGADGRDWKDAGNNAGRSICGLYHTTVSLVYASSFPQSKVIKQAILISLTYLHIV